MSNEMGKILVTGGCGFIGSHTSVLLLKLGYSITIIDSNSNSSPKSIKRITEIASMESIVLENKISFHHGDLLDYKFIENVFDIENSKFNKINYVIHFAGLKSVKESTNYPINYWDTNLVGTINLLKVMQKNECKNLIFSSSATVYSHKEKEFISEKDPLKPSNPYGNSKLAIESFLRDVYESYNENWRIACLRYFNPIGAHPSGLLGEDPCGIPNNIFPLINNVASGQKEFLEIFGDDWNTSDGTCIRDYIHVMDLAMAHIKTMELINSEKPQYLIMNVGTGIGTSVLELIKTFEKVNHLKIPFKITSRREGDFKNVVADNSFSYSLLKWKAELSLEDMCRDGWNWKTLNPFGYS